MRLNHVTPLVIVSLWMAGNGYLMSAQQSTVPEFSSPAEAGQTLLQAVNSNDEQAIARILGGPTDLTTSSDRAKDKADRELFVEKYQEMHRLGREADGSVTLYIGAENWPFPVPVVNNNGSWHFDSEAGKREVLLRRIGENELIALSHCEEFAAAEDRYAAASDDPKDGAATSLVTRAASASASGDPIRLNGYYYRLVPGASARARRTPSVALIVYPAEYRSTGVMTFVVTKHGVVYEKDLGANTTALASAMEVFHKDPTWRGAGE